MKAISVARRAIFGVVRLDLERDAVPKSRCGSRAIERGGQARTTRIASAKIDDIAPLLWQWTGGGQAVLCSDELASYRWIGRKMEGHHAVRYASEHGFRWDHREDVAVRIARCLIGQHGRLSWTDLVA